MNTLKSIFKAGISAWIISLSTLAGLVIVKFLIGKANFTLTAFPQRAIGIMVLEGIDATSRTGFYLSLLILFVCIFIISTLLLTILESKITKIFQAEGADIAFEKQSVFSLSLLSIFILVAHQISNIIVFADIFYILLFVIFLTLTVLVLKVYFKRKSSAIFYLVNNPDLVTLSFLFPLVIFFIRWILVNGSFIFNYKYFMAYLPLWVLFWLIMYLLSKLRLEVNQEKLLTAILTAAIPILLIPVSIPISNEIQFALSERYVSTAQNISIINISILLTVSLVIFLIKLRRKYSGKISFAAVYYFPILIATAVLLNIHKNFIDLTSLDMFHQGENLISTQQLFSYGKIPFIDTYPTHGISYMASQVLYSLVNGYRAFEPWLWEGLIKVFEILLLYFVIKKLTGSLFACLVVLFLPIIGILGGNRFTYGYNTSLATTYYLVSLAAALTFAWFIQKPNFFRVLSHWVICFFLIVWRVDFGLAAFATSFVILLLNNKLNFWKSSHRKILLISLGGLSVLVLLAGIVISLVENENFSKILVQIFQFVSIQAPTQALPNIASLSPTLTVFQYLILPSVGIFYFLFFLIHVIKNRLGSFGKAQWILLFLSIFSLIVSVRSVQRQTLAVLGYNPYLFAFLGISIPFYLHSLKKESAVALFTLMFFGYYLIFPNHTVILPTGRLVELYDWKNKETRVRVNDSQYRDLAKFLNENLSASQTFLDMTGSPLLYIATNKEFVPYFIPSQYYTSDPIQSFTLDRLKKYYQENLIPILIFRQPVDFGNKIDGVPNEIRSYRIYEYFYENYRPVGYLTGYMIWVANKYSLPTPENLQYTTTFGQYFELKQLPYIWATYDKYNAKEKTMILTRLIDKPVQISPVQTLRLPFNGRIDKSTGNYIHLRLKTAKNGSLILSYGKNPGSTVKMDLSGTDKAEDYLIRISSQWEWMSQNIKSVDLTSTAEAELIEAYIRKGD